MRNLAPIILLAFFTAAAATPAAAAAGDPKPKRKIIASAPADDTALRGPLSPSLAIAAPGAFAANLPDPGQALSLLSTAGLSAPPRISPLPAAGDPAPICRTTCATARAYCSSDECDMIWAQCVADCSAPKLN